ncbi:MAG: glycosyltransferase family 4 protein [Desulfobacterales bacterium]|nr:glycosyltransferase family 4 protein [Desulfobacterales bacterium]
MKPKNIIFHHPLNINTNPVSGSQIRPVQMIKAFIDAGFNVDTVFGTAKDRIKQIHKIKKEINSGKKYDFLYSESSTEPTMMTERHHLPIYFWVDFGFFYFCKSKGIPIGLFYRDIYWKFDGYAKEAAFWKKAGAKLFYRLDIVLYNKLIDVIFLPSKRMADYIPEIKTKIVSLPPGIFFDANKFQDSQKFSSNKDLIILYVGGIGDHYKMHLFFKAVNEINGVRLIICTRKFEWDKEKIYYSQDLSDKISIFHKYGKDLSILYREADICSLFVEAYEYWNFAMPIKLFEYMSYKKPIIASNKTAAGDFVKENNVGWVINYDKEELINLLKMLKLERDIISNKAENIDRILLNNTWKSRAITVAQTLAQKK